MKPSACILEVLTNIPRGMLAIGSSLKQLRKLKYQDICHSTLYFFIFQIIRLRREEESIDNIGQYWVQCETEELKYNAIANIYGVVTIGQAMIFCQTRKTASWLVEKMTKDGHAVALLSGNFQFLIFKIEFFSKFMYVHIFQES